MAILALARPGRERTFLVSSALRQFGGQRRWLVTGLASTCLACAGIVLIVSVSTLRTDLLPFAFRQVEPPPGASAGKPGGVGRFAHALSDLAGRSLARHVAHSQVFSTSRQMPLRAAAWTKVCLQPSAMTCLAHGRPGPLQELIHGHAGDPFFKSGYQATVARLWKKASEPFGRTSSHPAQSVLPKSGSNATAGQLPPLGHEHLPGHPHPAEETEARPAQQGQHAPAPPGNTSLRRRTNSSHRCFPASLSSSRPTLLRLPPRTLSPRLRSPSCTTRPLSRNALTAGRKLSQTSTTKFGPALLCSSSTQHSRPANSSGLAGQHCT